MTLNNFMQTKKNRHVSLKAALKILRGKWYEGEVNRFDLKLAAILGCSIERAEEIRESWVSMGFLAYTRRGLLKWRNGGF